MNPRVSVIVPVYNAEKFLSLCLDSLVKQTYSNLEIIVINDGSTDGSQEIISNYQKRYPQIISYQKKNEGIAETRNFGLSKISGEYFGFLDSDDIAETTMIEKMINKAIEEKSELVVSNFTWVYPKQEILQQEGPYEEGKEMVIRLFATLWNKLYKTEFIKSTQLQFPSGNRYEDAYFLYCLAPQVKKLSFVNESFVSYIQHDSSITHTHNNQVKNMITVFELIVKYYQEKGWYDEYYAELEYIHIRFFLGNSFLRSAQIKDKFDRERTILLGWDLLNKEFPRWRRNHYLKSSGGIKNRYYRSVYRWNLMLFAWIFNKIKRK